MPVNAGDASLLGLIDRLGDAARAERPDRARGRGRQHRARPPQAHRARPAARGPRAAIDGSRRRRGPGVDAGRRRASRRRSAAPSRPAINAPLTGIWYGSPAPGSAPFVEVGREVAVGQVVGLIEAMKLFNEIKSDLAGRVVRVVPDSGSLVKAKQPLIEVEPL